MRTAIVWEASPHHHKILVEGAPLQTMDRYRQDRSDKTEAGGILLGYRKGPHLHIVQVTVPQLTDRCRRFRFDRSAHHHQQIALDQWHVSEKTMDYLGEWHTHPEINPSPSGVDINEWVKITNRQTKPMVFMILGLTGTIWLGLSVNNALIKCSPTTTEGA
ncbi:Mov34/MPN/PAD-1 family protein [Pseudomonas paracarnis]|uniref:Mov34/MPN/PAD-1 family protein n=1 Tax=Pseudomonas paracarnis TaxID=2750625 RepID=UPI00191BBAA3|nr:Mov34/MPN/PAD-1 family protein [Pseudomonas paracarnis]